MALDGKRLTSQNVSPYQREAFYIHGTDSIATMQGSGYFSAAYLALPKSTILHLVGTADTTPVAVDAVVTASSAAGVTIAVAESSAGAGITGGGAILRESKVSSKGSDAEVVRWVAPFKGRITKIDTILNGALATGNSTVTVAIAGTNVTTGAVTLVQSGSAAGDKGSATPTALNTFNAGDIITATVSGSSTATATFNIALTCEELP